MPKAILCCDCGHVPSKAVATYEVVFKDEVPPRYVGKNGISTFLEKYQNGDVAQYAKALMNNHEKFAYYMEWDEEGLVTTQYNLLTRKQLI